jgi:hypothetical protein
MVDVMEKTKFEVPEKTDIEGITELTQLSDDMHGVKTLRERVHKFLAHTRLADKFYNGIVTSINTINGVRTSTGPRAATKEAVARRYFESLVIPNVTKSRQKNLLMHCSFWQVDPDEYATTEELINALVQVQCWAVSQDSLDKDSDDSDEDL